MRSAINHLTVYVLVALALLGASPARVFCADADSDLGSLSLSELANVDVTSVSKSTQSLQQAAASIFVITHDAIRASAASNVMEALRLAPNLLVTQLSASSFVIAARGFGGNPVAQSFSNKLLVLIDGRSVYSPLYSGVYSDSVDVPLEDIDRIEVISGPGATLWGANAMNGVVNIITRSAYGSHEDYADLGAGNQTQFGDARLGGALGEGGAIRVYGMGFHRATEELGPGLNARDEWGKAQGGFRADWTHGHDEWTLQGDLYKALEDDPSGQDGLLAGANVIARYRRHEQISDFQAQFYVDQSERFGPLNQGAFVLHTYDLELQESLEMGRNHWVFGGGERLNSYAITDTSTLLFVPAEHRLSLGNVFIEDTLAVSRRVDLTAGFKMEDDPYSGWSSLPDVRLTWLATDRTTYWAAASRAIRSPTPFDTDVVEKIGPMLALRGNHNFDPEMLDAYQIGMRAQPLQALSFALTAFDHEYDKLRTIEPAGPDEFFPLLFDNLLKAQTQGVEFWANWQVRDGWLISPGATWQHEHFTFKPGSSALLGPSTATDDPSIHANLNSTLQLPGKIQLFASLRYVGALPAPALAAYVDADARIARAFGAHWEASIAGVNLLHGERAEFAVPNGERISRSVFAEIRWKR
jgi:iron complex outermembrane recepter protein